MNMSYALPPVDRPDMFCMSRDVANRHGEPIVAYGDLLEGEQDLLLFDLAVSAEAGATTPTFDFENWRNRRSSWYGILPVEVLPMDDEATAEIPDHTEYGTDEDPERWHAGLSAVLNTGIAMLDPKNATAVRLSFGNGFTYEEIARHMVITPDEARRLVARGLSMLRSPIIQKKSGLDLYGSIKVRRYF